MIHYKAGNFQRFVIGEDPGRSLLVAASEPAVTIAAILSIVIEAAVAVSEADLGGAVQLCGDPESTARAALSDNQGESAIQLLRKRGPLSRGAAPWLAETVEFPIRRSSSGAPAARSALLFPVIEHRRPVAQLCLMSSKPGSHWRRTRTRLDGLASSAAAAIRRVELRQRFDRLGADLDLVGVSPAFLELEHQTKMAAAYPNGTVLILGERGCGKELLAHAIHEWGDRRDKPFVPVLASALSEALVADELYGHERNSFTGAVRRRDGKFQAADGGTVFLD